MNLNQLEYFINAAETLNFTKAAAKCFISQTAMTQQIRSLEKSIGTDLFIRDKHHCELTPAGKVFLKEARAILARSTNAVRLARNASVGETGSIRIGYIRGYGDSELLTILRDFHSTYPNIKITFYRENSSRLFEALENGKCDVIFTVSPSSQRNPELNYQYLESYPLMAVVDAGHQLAGKQAVHFSELENEDYILMQPEGRAKDEAQECLVIQSRGGFFPNVTALEGDPESLFMMISTGLGISILPEYITRRHMKSQFIKVLPIFKQDETAETVDFEVNWRKQNVNPTVDELLEFVNGEKF